MTDCVPVVIFAFLCNVFHNVLGVEKRQELADCIDSEHLKLLFYGTIQEGLRGFFKLTCFHDCFFSPTYRISFFLFITVSLYNVSKALVSFPPFAFFFHAHTLCLVYCLLFDYFYIYETSRVSFLS